MPRILRCVLGVLLDAFLNDAVHAVGSLDQGQAVGGGHRGPQGEEDAERWRKRHVPTVPPLLGAESPGPRWVLGRSGKGR
ncbi:hypothetical protein [Actinomyces lilanjuaniae]|uniref:hypothetical protein n=1 Tax=Actinomyces lilanjuaniae TaxID=2321394 RepID=UPI0019693BD5|nr:hypothetical protein [Actinomyces lilanjuaniae]